MQESLQVEFVDSYLDATVGFKGSGELFQVPQQMQMNSLGGPGSSFSS